MSSRKYSLTYGCIVVYSFEVRQDLLKIVMQNRNPITCRQPRSIAPFSYILGSQSFFFLALFHVCIYLASRSLLAYVSH